VRRIFKTMKPKKYVAASLVAAFVAFELAFPLAGAGGDFLAIKIAITQSETNELEAELVTHGLIPKDGSGGAFGYGILTGAGLDWIIVASNHGGAQSSDL